MNLRALLTWGVGAASVLAAQQPILADLNPDRSSEPARQRTCRRHDLAGVNDRWPRPLPLKRAPAVFRRVFPLRWHLWPPEHGVRREADIEHLPQALPGGGERVLREADQHV